MKQYPLTIAATLLLLAAGCEPVQHYNRVRSAPFMAAQPKIPVSSVHVYQTAEEIKAKYEVVALFTVDGDAADEAAMLNAMLYRAAAIGANGLLLNPPRATAGEDPGTSNNQNMNIRLGWAALIDSNGNRRIYRAQAIKVP